MRIATATAAVITGYGLSYPEMSYVANCIMRSLDTIIGVIVSLSFALIFTKLGIRAKRT